MSFEIKHYIMDALTAAENRGDTFLPLAQLCSELAAKKIPALETAAALEELIA